MAASVCVNFNLRPNIPCRSSERDLQLRLEDAFVWPVLGLGGRTGAPVEERVRIVELPLDVVAQIPVDARRPLGRSFRGHARLGETQFELAGLRGGGGGSARQLPSAPTSTSRGGR